MASRSTSLNKANKRHRGAKTKTGGQLAYFVYLIECADKSLYTGITTDVKRRLSEHQAGKGGHYTRSRLALRVVFTEEYPNRGSALKREAQIKRWSRKRKLQLTRNKL